MTYFCILWRYVLSEQKENSCDFSETIMNMYLHFTAKHSYHTCMKYIYVYKNHIYSYVYMDI